MATEVKYNGSTLMNLESGKIAKLATSGKKLLADIEIINSNNEQSGSYKEPALIPHTIEENGTYETAVKAATATWGVNTTYDFTVPIEDGVTLNVKKLENFSIPDDISAFDNPIFKLSITQNGSTWDYELTNIGLFAFTDENDELAGYMSTYLYYTILWIKNAAIFNAELPEPVLEDNTVYVSNFLQLTRDGWTECTITAPSESELMCLSPLTVDVQPDLTTLKAVENGTYTPPTWADGYKSVTVDVPVPTGYIIPTGQKTIASNGYHTVTQYDSVLVEVPGEVIEVYDGRIEVV